MGKYEEAADELEIIDKVLALSEWGLTFAASLIQPLFDEWGFWWNPDHKPATFAPHKTIRKSDLGSANKTLQHMTLSVFYRLLW